MGTLSAQEATGRGNPRGGAALRNAFARRKAAWIATGPQPSQ
jgi:hypothetical protein